MAAFIVICFIMPDMVAIGGSLDGAVATHRFGLAIGEEGGHIHVQHPLFFEFGPHLHLSVEAVTTAGNRCAA